MASFRTLPLLRDDDMPKVIRVELPEGVADSRKANGLAFVSATSDETAYFRRWAEDVRAEYKRAVARRTFFRYWTPVETSSEP